MKKAAIIGGGLAGLATAICLNKIGIEVKIYERSESYNNYGMGFLMLPNGLFAMEVMGLDEEYLARSVELSRFIHRYPDGSIIREAKLEEFISISRYALLDVLQNALPPDTVVFGHNFSRFQEDENGTIVAVEFKNGQVIEADLFVAADGSNSAIRRQLFPDYNLIPQQENEIVGLIDAPGIIAELGPNFLKTQKENEGLSFGALPANSEKLIWFMQFDVNRFPPPENNPRSIESFVRDTVGNWAFPIPRILDASNFDRVHLWKVKALDPLPVYHHKEIVLVGDSAHPLLPLTSQGANSALLDGVQLARCIKAARQNGDTLAWALEEYDRKRIIVMNTFIKNGKVLLDRFLHPVSLDKDPLPFLISTTSKG